ncbi:alanine racemase [Oleiharenicola sp. Vm1]|uniref:alanine racemase n=1 Tax=Oleiharenicola sp. Vm1 TaxID=3398393 RepID=UPI0039F5B3A5
MSSEFPSRPAPTLEQLPTPCLVLERGKLAHNLARLAATAAIKGVRFRPHLKTAKSADIAHLAAPPPEGAITVSTLREAEYFAHHGWRDIFYAVGLGPGKLPRCTALARAGVDLAVMVDHAAAARALRTHARAERVRFRALIEIDSGDRRGGLPPDSPELIPVAQELGPLFAGVATHGGFSYAERDAAGFARVAALEASALRTAAARLHAAGFPARCSASVRVRPPSPRRTSPASPSFARASTCSGIATRPGSAPAATTTSRSACSPRSSAARRTGRTSS